MLSEARSGATSGWRRGDEMRVIASVADSTQGSARDPGMSYSLDSCVQSLFPFAKATS